MKLMIVEDNPMNLKLIKLLIRDIDCNTIYCDNGKEALDQFYDVKPDLILCDIQMPEVDGIEVLQHIRKHPDLSSTKIIAITAHALVGDRERFIRMGFDDYMSKPFDTRKFRSLIQEYQKTFDADA